MGPRKVFVSHRFGAWLPAQHCAQKARRRVAPGHRYHLHGKGALPEPTRQSITVMAEGYGELEKADGHESPAQLPHPDWITDGGKAHVPRNRSGRWLW